MHYKALLVSAGLALTQVNAQSQSCSTKYASTSTTKVPTSTSTVTRTVAGTKTVTATGTVTLPPSSPETVTITSFDVSSTVFWTTKAGTTLTIPLPKGFTPMASATTASGVSPNRRARRNDILQAANKRAPAAAATTSFPATVICSATVSKTGPATTSTTTTIFKTIQSTPTVTQTVTYTTTSATTSTATPATRTVHAACLPSANNIIETINSRSINYWDAEGLKSGYSGSPLDPNPDTRAANQSPQDCCETAWTLGEGGFEYYGSIGYTGICITVEPNSDGIFFVGPFTSFGNGGRIYVGNGPGGSPSFEGFFQSGNPS